MALPDMHKSCRIQSRLLTSPGACPAPRSGSVDILPAVTLLARLSTRRLEITGIAAGLCLLALFLGFLVLPQRLPYLPLAFSMVGDLCGKLAGAPFAAAVELFSIRLDDNFSVLLITGGFLAALRYFFGI